MLGLNTTQIVQVVDRLKEHDMLECLRLLHYHLGSQIPNIRDIRAAVLEACRVYAGLVHEGATMGYFDLNNPANGTQNFGGIRPGCWINTIPAGGIVLMPDATDRCNCSYLNKATIALQPLEN